MVPYGQQIDGFNLGEALQGLCIVGLDPGLEHAHKHMRVCPDLTRNSPSWKKGGKENLDFNQSLLEDRTYVLSYLTCCHTRQCNALSESELSELQEVNEQTQL